MSLSRGSNSVCLLPVDKGEDSGMESRGDQQMEREVSELSALDSRLSVLAKKGPIQVSD